MSGNWSGGSSGWGNPVVGGTALRIPAIESPNYSAGSTGWIIKNDGTVEFNDGTFRGTITASTFDGTDFVLNTSGMFFYSGTPALGNLVASITKAAGTDGFGNVYSAGYTTYEPSGANYSYFNQLNQNTLLFHYNSATLFINPGRIDANEPLVNAQSPYLRMRSPNDSTPAAGTAQQAELRLLGTSEDGTEAATVKVTGIDQTGAEVPCDITINGLWFQANVNGLFGYSPSPGTGNLIWSFTNSSGTDAYGNTFQLGITTYKSSSTYLQQHVNATVSAPATEMVTGAATEHSHAAEYTEVVNAGLANEYMATFLQGPASTLDSKSAALVLLSAAHDNSAEAAGEFVWFAPAESVVGFWDAAGIHGSALIAATYLDLDTQAGTPATPTGAVRMYSGNTNRALSYIKPTFTNNVYRLSSTTGTQQGGNTNNTTNLNNLTNAYAIDANDAVNGTVYRLVCGGHGTQAGTTPVNLVFQLFAFGLAWGNSDDAGGVAAGTGFHWRFEGELVIGGNTNSSPASFGGQMVMSEAIANAQGHTTAMDQQRTNGVDTTTGTNISFQAGWASVVNSPTVVCTYAYLERLGVLCLLAAISVMCRSGWWRRSWTR